MEKITSFGDMKLPNGTDLTLKTMFEAKETLLVNYYNAEKLKFKWSESNIHTRETQNWVRESMGCLIEEIFEAKTVLDYGLEIIKDDPIKQKGVDRITQDYREEQADVLHFWVEVFLFSGLNYYDITLYYYDLFEEKGLSRNNLDGFFLAMDYANYLNFTVKTYPGSPLISLVKIPLVADFGNKYLLNSLHYLNIARNQLKNKYWKTSEVDTNAEAYFKPLMEAFIYYTMYLNIIGFKPSDIIEDYLKKNLVNQERIKKGW